MPVFPLRECSDWLQSQLGCGLRRHEPVGGGCIHQAWGLQASDGRSFFAKTNSAAALPMFEAEAAGLEALARWAPPELVVPRPLALGVVAGCAVLVLPWLNLTGRGSWSALGRGLARLHRNSLAGNQGRGFGFEAGNFIGSAPQPNHWHGSWPAFFAACRLAPQLATAAAMGQAYRGGQTLLDRLPELLAGHHCEPVLVHGDLWSGNAGLVSAGSSGAGPCGAIFDPACSWADREVDLAMARLFGGFPSSFFEGYGEAWPLPPGAEQRRDLYNLYHLLNHANLFGGSYRSQAQHSITALLAGG